MEVEPSRRGGGDCASGGGGVSCVNRGLLDIAGGI